MNQNRKLLPVVSLLLAMGSCGSGISGTFADDAQLTAYEFHTDGRATISVLGATVAAEYTVDRDRVVVTSAQGTVVLRHREDRLYGPMGLELIRQSE